MPLRRPLRRALPLAVAGLTLTASGVAAFEPAETLILADEGQHYTVTDLAGRGTNAAVSIDGSLDDERWVTVYWTQNGTDWDHNDVPASLARESQATICDGWVVVAHAASETAPATDWELWTSRYSLDGLLSGTTVIADSGVNRKPDVACVPEKKIAVAYFAPSGSGPRVQLVVRKAAGEDLAPQSFDIAPGSVSKGLAVAATSQRVYVAWFQGNALKLRRYSVGPAPDRTLTNLGTQTILTHASARNPQLGADGSRVILAYQHQADLRVRRSTDRGVTFSSAVTVRNMPFPSEIATSPTSVTVKGKRVVLGAFELGGVETLTGKGFGYESTNGGATWRLKAKHNGGSKVVTLVTVEGTRRYAEAWDASVAQPAQEFVKFRTE
jgi:hypothetical protein